MTPPPQELKTEQHITDYTQALQRINELQLPVSYMNTPKRTLGNKTPLQLITNNQTPTLIKYLNSLSFGTQILAGTTTNPKIVHITPQT